MSEQIRRCVGSIIFVPDRRRFGDLYVRIRTIIRLFLILAQKNPAVFYSGIFYEGENETYIEASVENSSSILYDKEIRNKPRTRRTKRNV